MTQPTTPPGWYPDPSGGPDQRYFDGKDWTDQRAPAQQTAYAAPPKKRKVWPWVLGGILLVILLGFGACAAFVGSVASEISKDSPVTVKPSDGGAPSTDNGPDFPGKQSGDTGVEAGGSVTSDDVTTTSSPLTPNMQFGDTYLCTQVTIQNGGKKPATFNSAFDWKLQDPTGTTRSASLMGSDNTLSSGEVAPGGTAKGDVCFDDKSGSATGTYVVLFDPTFRLSSGRIGWINQL